MPSTQEPEFTAEEIAEIKAEAHATVEAAKRTNAKRYAVYLLGLLRQLAGGKAVGEAN
jgi:hypothetical protein